MRKIEWNKVTWYSKLIAAVLFVGVMTGGFWLGLYTGYLKGYIAGVEYFLPGANISTSTVATGSVAKNSYDQNTAEWQTATDAAGSFSIAYPVDFSTNENPVPEVTPNWSLSSNGVSGNLFFTLTIPSLFEPQTNFADATLTVGASGDDATVQNCIAVAENVGPVTYATTTINGIPFSIYGSSGAGAGNLYQMTSYRTIHNGQCYAIEYTIHSSQLGNWPTQYNLKQFDPAPLTDVLNRIVGTFKFE